MPYVIRPPRLRAAVAACAAALMVGAVPAQAEITSPSQCKEPVFTQAFLYAGDINWYTLVPGEAANNFEGTGWTLSGGAAIKKTTLQNGNAGYVLDLPTSSSALSPTFCVNNEYPTARAIIRNVLGSGADVFYVSYSETKTWEAPKNIGTASGKGTEWTLTAPLKMHVEKTSGWQLVRLKVVGSGTASDSQLYNLYVDPYVRR